MSRRGSPFARRRVWCIVGNEGLGRVEADDLLRQPGAGVLSGKLRDGELTGADVDPGEPPAFTEHVESRQIAILTSREEGRVGNGARADHAGDGALDQPAAGRGHL